MAYIIIWMRGVEVKDTKTSPADASRYGTSSEKKKMDSLKFRDDDPNGFERFTISRTLSC